MSVAEKHSRDRVAVRRLFVATASVAVVLLMSIGASPALAATPVISEESALAGPHSATIRAEIDPEGQDTRCKLQYVTEAQYQATEYDEATSLPCRPTVLESEPGVLPAESTELQVTDELEGLSLNTSYRFRFVATNASGEEARGSGAQFATFGLETLRFGLADVDGNPFTQAGGHPYEFTTNIAINHASLADASGNIKNVEVALPTGLIGDPAATPRCTARAAELRKCSSDSQVGTLDVIIPEESGKEVPNLEPLFNMTPPEGYAAAFSARINNFTNAFIYAHVRAGSDYGVDAGSLDISDQANIRRVIVTLWGVPANAGHDEERSCSVVSAGVDNYTYETPCAKPTLPPNTPFLTDPTSCTGTQLAGAASVDSWQSPTEYVSAKSLLPAITGCGKVSFNPALTVSAESITADSPTGLHIDLSVPQNEEPKGIASSDLRDATIVFPSGLTVNPSSANGLGSCSESEVGFTGYAELQPETEPGEQTAQFTPTPAECQAASKLGTVEVDTPLVEHPLTGGLYLATPHQNPSGSLVAVYLTVYDPVTGVVIKLPGEVHLDPQTGQVTTTFDNNPQLPFEHLKVNLFNSETRPAFTTPETCGAYSTSGTLEPWSHKSAPGEEAGTPDAMPSSAPFQVSEAPGGGACAASEAQAANSPRFEAGTASPVAGTYSPLVVKLKREDGSQRFGALNVTLPPGLVGKVAGVEECPQADIEAAQRLAVEGQGAVEQTHPSCPSGSELGVVKVGAGSGTPYYVTGRVYFAGPYEGAPFSLVIVTPAVAGPFDLGTVVVRAALFINQTTAQVTVKSDPFPSILDGIPLDIRSVDVEITRPEFTLNPTSCNGMTITGEEISTASLVASLADRFQAGGCDTMRFSPHFSASTKHKANRKDGAALVVKLAQKSGEADLAKAEVELPIQFSARDSTLNHACTEAQYAANASGCPEDSVVGMATAVTPLLSKPLTGPAIYVSHGGLKFPDLDVVLQGEGVTIELTGKTEIVGKRTFSRFETVPDAPIASFRLTLPEGPHSALSANLPTKARFSYCGEKLDMATRLVGQNGATREQQTNVAVEGCEPILKVLSQKGGAGSARITVQVPSAGELFATGKGFLRATYKAKKAGSFALKLKLTHSEVLHLAKHLRQRVTIEVTLRFQRARGKALTQKLKLGVGR